MPLCRPKQIAIATALALLATSPLLAQSASGDKEAARAFIQPYFDAPSPFPIKEPLDRRPAGKKIAMIDCGSPICALFYDIATIPAELLGMEITRIRSGLTADGVAGAFETVLSAGYDGVFVPALPPSLWNRYLDELHAAGIPVVTTGIIGVDSNKVAVAAAAEPANTSGTKILANWVVAQYGPETNTVFYNTPEFSFSNFTAKVFVDTLAEICASCTVRVVDIPVASFGSNAPSIVVDDLLAHPDTTTAVFSVGEQTIGLPSAVKVADIKIRTALNAPDPSVLAGIKNGTYDVGLGADLSVQIWTLIDSLARLTTGQEPSESARRDEPVRQLLNAENLTGDIERGWNGYPDYAERFQALWADAK